AMQGRGFAYLGIPPLYVGEIALIVGILTLIFGSARWRFSPLQILTIAFMALGLLRTLPYVEGYRTLALRDAALWYYATFMLIVSMLLTRERLLAALALYARFVPILLIWFVFMSTVLRSFANK